MLLWMYPHVPTVYGIGRRSCLTKIHHNHGYFTFWIVTRQTVNNVGNSKVCITADEEQRMIRTGRRNMPWCYPWSSVGEVQLMGALRGQVEGSQR